MDVIGWRSLVAKFHLARDGYGLPAFICRRDFAQGNQPCGAGGTKELSTIHVFSFP